MTENVIGVYDGRWQSPAGDGLAARLERARWNKANPRDRAYMEALFAERYPGGVFLDVAEEPEWAARLSGAVTVVFLYPDAIGLGFRGTEAEAHRAAQGGALRVLNGRRRDFELDSSTRRQLRVRRFMERWMVGELLLLSPFLVLTPLLLAIDLLRGRA